MRTTKDLIIETTIRMIQSAGSDPAQITIRDISKEAGIAVSQINYHFSSKDNLIAICVQRVIRDVISLFGDHLKQVNDLSSIEKLKHMVNLTFGFLYENENLSRISILTDYQNGAPGDNTSLTLKAYFPLIETVCRERNIPNAGLVAESILLTLQGAFLRSDILKDELQIDLRNQEQRAAFVNSVLEQHLGLLENSNVFTGGGNVDVSIASGADLMVTGQSLSGNVTIARRFKSGEPALTIKSDQGNISVKEHTANAENRMKKR